MAVPRSDSPTGDPVDEDSSAGRPLHEDHRWLRDDDPDEEPRRPTVKVARAPHPRVRLARGARKRA